MFTKALSNHIVFIDNQVSVFTFLALDWRLKIILTHGSLKNFRLRFLFFLSDNSEVHHYLSQKTITQFSILGCLCMPSKRMLLDVNCDEKIDCDAQNNATDPDSITPVCATDGHTYDSKCHMALENQRRYCV